MTKLEGLSRHHVSLRDVSHACAESWTSFSTNYGYTSSNKHIVTNTM